ncbi:T-cell activation Rho GTPase-activating protein-like [Amazona ochrocephala]
MARDLSCSRGTGAIRLCWYRGSLWPPLAALCSQEGMLPQPIQDLLALLKEHGPSTEGIFSLAASERASVRSGLRSTLINIWVEVHLESQLVLLLAVIFKNLLRKIPFKLRDIQGVDEHPAEDQQAGEADSTERGGQQVTRGQPPPASTLAVPAP